MFLGSYFFYGCLKFCILKNIIKFKFVLENVFFNEVYKK